MAKKEERFNWKQIKERARRSDNQALHGNSSGSKATEPYSPQQQTGRFDWQSVMSRAREMDGSGETQTTTSREQTYQRPEWLEEMLEKQAAQQKQVQDMTAAGLPLVVQRQRTLGQMSGSDLYKRYQNAMADADTAQRRVTQMTAAGQPLVVQRQRTQGQMSGEELYARYRAAMAEIAAAKQSVQQRGGFAENQVTGNGEKTRGFGREDGKRAVERAGQVTEQEFNRSTAMQEKYGSYQNYLRGVYAGYDDAMKKLRQQQAAEQEAAGKVTQSEFNRSTAMQQKYGTYKNYLNGTEITTDKQTHYQAQNARMDNLGIREDVKRYFELDVDEDREEKDALRQRFDELGVTGKDLSDFRALLKNPKLMGNYVGFGEAAADAFFSGSPASWLGGMEATRAVAEAGANKAAAWALRDLAKSKVLGGVFGQQYRDSLNGLADRLATDTDWSGAQAWQDEYSRIMERATKDRTAVGKFVVENLPSVGSMILDAGLAGLSGVNPARGTTNISAMASMATRA